MLEEIVAGSLVALVGAGTGGLAVYSITEAIKVGVLNFLFERFPNTSLHYGDIAFLISAIVGIIVATQTEFSAFAEVGIDLGLAGQILTGFLLGATSNAFYNNVISNPSPEVIVIEHEETQESVG